MTKLNVSADKFQINLKFYFYLKHLVKTKLTEPQANQLLEVLLREKHSRRALTNFSETLKGQAKLENFLLLIDKIESAQDVTLFLFSLRLYLIKDALLAEAKLSKVLLSEEMAKLDPLSLEYDNKSVFQPYAARVNGALLSLLFFEKLEKGETGFISQGTENFLKNMKVEVQKLKKCGLEPNQIFMLMFSESVNQSITSDSGSNYEDRILSVLVNLGIPHDGIQKIHDEHDKSTEFDFFFTLNNKTYGIGAKRTLRERYKQFIKTALGSHIDVMIQITLGLDLNEAKAKTILSHGTKLFVADEVYQSRDFLRKLDGIFSVKNLNLKTLQNLGKKTLTSP